MHFVLQLFGINAFYLGDNPAGSFSLSFSSSFSFSFNSSKSTTYRIDMRKKGALSLKYYFLALSMISSTLLFGFTIAEYVPTSIYDQGRLFYFQRATETSKWPKGRRRKTVPKVVL